MNNRVKEKKLRLDPLLSNTCGFYQDMLSKTEDFGFAKVFVLKEDERNPDCDRKKLSLSLRNKEMKGTTIITNSHIALMLMTFLWKARSLVANWFQIRRVNRSTNWAIIQPRNGHLVLTIHPSIHEIRFILRFHCQSPGFLKSSICLDHTRIATDVPSGREIQQWQSFKDFSTSQICPERDFKWIGKLE